MYNFSAIWCASLVFRFTFLLFEPLQVRIVFEKMFFEPHLLFRYWAIGKRLLWWTPYLSGRRCLQIGRYVRLDHTASQCIWYKHTFRTLFIIEFLISRPPSTSSYNLYDGALVSIQVSRQIYSNNLCYIHRVLSNS